GEELHALAFEERRLGWKPAGLLVLARERLRRDLAGLNVRLIERVDAEHRAGDGRRDLPSHELFAEVVFRRHPNSDDWSAGLLQCGYAGILCGIGLVLEAQICEHSIVAVDLRRSERFAIHRDDALAVLAGGLGNELLEPRTEIVNAWRR